MKLSRREWLLAARAGIFITVSPSCGLAGVIIRVGPKIGKIAAVLFGVADGIMTIYDLYRRVEDSIEIKLTDEQIAKLQSNSTLIIIDNAGHKFSPKISFFQAIGKTQPGFHGEPLFVFEKLDFSSRAIKQLKISEPVGVFDLRYGSQSGWYQVQTLPTREGETGASGWISGYCLERLPVEKQTM